MPLSLLIFLERWGKSKCAALGRPLAWGCSSFDFAEALAFILLFSCFYVDRVVF
jgi:hypothetical protein